MSDLEALSSAVGRRTRLDRTFVTWFDQQVCDLLDPDAAQRLAAIAYSSAYCLGRPAPMDERTEARVDSHWYEVPEDPRLRAWWSGWRPDAHGGLAAPGQPTVRSPTPVAPTARPLALELAGMSTEAIPGWLLLRHGEAAHSEPTLRVYANTRADLLRPLIGRLVSVLLDHGLIRFAAKMLMTSDHAARADSTVLYLPGGVSTALLHDIGTVLHGAVVSPAVPMFTCPYQPGIALARSPADGRSFGETRCRQVADTLVDAYRAHGSTPTDWPFDRQAPWDDASSPPLKRLVPRGIRPPVTRRLHDPECRLLSLARELSAAAHLAGGRATWLVREPVRGRLVAAGAAVYDGSAGALAVLTHAFRITGDAGHLHLARATARDMLARQPDLPSEGFHSGRAGTAAVLSEAALVTGDAEITEIAVRSLATAGEPAPPGHDWDVVAGTAGTILGLRIAGAFLGAEPPCDLARLCHRLARRSEPDPSSGGVRWRSHVARRRPALAGLAHGASGAALALSAGEPTGTAVPDLVRRAVQFEDRARMMPTGWTDHRIPGARVPAVAWCHGAGGIGIVSAALAHRHGSPFIPRAVMAAERLGAALSTPSSDSGLCHGSAGRALALAVVNRSLNRPDPDREAIAAFDRLPPREAEPGTLMNGEIGVVLAALAVVGAIPPPIAFVVDVGLWNAPGFTAPSW